MAAQAAIHASVKSFTSSRAHRREAFLGARLRGHDVLGVGSAVIRSTLPFVMLIEPRRRRHPLHAKFPHPLCDKLSGPGHLVGRRSPECVAARAWLKIARVLPGRTINSGASSPVCAACDAIACQINSYDDARASNMLARFVVRPRLRIVFVSQLANARLRSRGARRIRSQAACPFRTCAHIAPSFHLSCTRSWSRTCRT